MKFTYWPEILFVVFVILFLFALPTYFILKLILMNVCVILLCFSIYEYWSRNRKVEQVKEEKIKFLENQVLKIQAQADAMELKMKEKTLQKLKEQEEYQQKLLELQKKEDEEAERERIQRKKDLLRPQVVQLIQNFVNKNYRTLVDADYRRFSNFISREKLDERLIYSDNPHMEKLEEKFSSVVLTKSLAEVIEIGKVYDEHFDELQKTITEEFSPIETVVLEELILEELENKEYQLFKDKLYSEKKSLKYTIEVHDYLMAFMEVFMTEERENLDRFVRLLQEDVDKKIVKELIEPLVEQELNRIL